MNEIRRTYSLSVLYRREGPKLWAAQCLDLGIASAGASLEHAQHMIAEAIGMVLAEDLVTGRNPFDRPGWSPDDWAAFKHAVAYGVKVESLNDVAKSSDVVAQPLIFNLRVKSVSEVIAGRPQYDIVDPTDQYDTLATFAEAA